MTIPVNASSAARTASTTAARALAVLAVVSVIVFGIIALLPGDAVTLRAAGRMTPEQVASLRSAAGLDDPVAVRYLAWLRDVVVGDLGTSTSTGRSVASMLANRMPVSAGVIAVALAVVLPAAVVFGVLSSRGGRGSGPSAAVTTIAALPQAVVAAVVAAVLAGWAGVVPPVSLIPRGDSPFANLDLLLLPALTLAIPAAAYGALMLRGPLVTAVSAPHVVDARIRGVGRLRTTVLYILPTVAAPAVRVLAFVVGGLICGTALVENIFGLAGIGELFVSSIATRDVAVVQAISMIAAIVVVAGMALADTVSACTGRWRTS